jgi:hypothetical protein
LVLKTDPISGASPTHFWPALVTLWVITFALVLYSTMRMPGSIQACSSVRNDPCIFPPDRFLVYPSISGMAIGIILVAIALGGWKVVGLLVLLLSAALRLLDAYIALDPNAMGNPAAQYDWYHDVIINRPTPGGWIAFGGSLVLVVLAIVGMIQLVRTEPHRVEPQSKRA